MGLETLAQVRSDRWLGLVSMTLSRSTRVDRPGDDPRLFEYDQPLVLSALGSHELPRGWRLGARARLGSGNPYTPVVNRVYDLDSREFMPVYGEADSARLPTFFSFDVRIDKTWERRTWDFTVYLDLQNATNNTNPEVMAWTTDYDAEDPVSSTPVLPAFGIKADW